MYVQTQSILEGHIVIRGDIAPINIEKYAVICAGAVLRPPEQVGPTGISLMPMIIGNYCVIEAGAMVQASELKDFVRVGAGAVVGPRCFLSSCTVVLPNAVLAAETVVEPFAIYGGAPAKKVGTLPESWSMIWKDYVKDFVHGFNLIKIKKVKT
jgi:dynactin 5